MTTTPTLFHIRDYRGATIEDLDIKPAISINPSTHIQDALEISFEHEFTFLPVIHEANRRLLGVLNLEELKKSPEKIQRSFLQPVVKNYMIWFNQKARENYEAEASSSVSKTPLNTTIMKPKTGRGKRYSVLTPLSPLEDLAKFFNGGQYFAIVTNDKGNFVYGVATPEDLIRYENSRPKL